MEDFDMDDMLRKLLTAFLAFIMAVAICGIIGAAGKLQECGVCEGAGISYGV